MEPSTDSSSLEDFLLSFRNLCMWPDRVESNGTGASLGNNSLALAANGSLRRTQQVEVAVDPPYDAWFEDSMHIPSSFCYESIWADHTLSSGGMTMTMNSGFGAPSTTNWAACGLMSQSSSVNLRSSGGLSNQIDLNYAGLYRKNTFESLQGCDIINMAVARSGSFYLQHMLSLNDPEIASKMFKGVVDFIFELMTDQNGHHLFMKLIGKCNDKQLQLIVDKITFQSTLFFDASIDRYGSYSIQKLIKVLQKSALISEVMLTLCSEFFGMMTNRTGSYVILKCLDILDSQENELLYQAAIQNCLQLATHEKGCISLTNFITNMKGPRRDQLLDLISKHAVYLSHDLSGNYIVQHVVGLHNPVFSEKICSLLKGHYIHLSLQKCGSHVVEKCLNSPWKDHVIKDFLKSNQLFQVAKDPYGNYVIQTALRVTKRVDSPLHHNLLMKLKPYLSALQSGYGYGRNVSILVSDELSAKKV